MKMDAIEALTNAAIGPARHLSQDTLREGSMSNHDACPRMSIPRFADSPADVLRRAINRAAEHHGVTVAEIKGRSRLGRAAAARQDVFLALREAGWSFPRIGRAMGRDHSTVMHGVAVAEARSHGSMGAAE